MFDTVAQTVKIPSVLLRTLDSNRLLQLAQDSRRFSGRTLAETREPARGFFLTGPVHTRSSGTSRKHKKRQHYAPFVLLPDLIQLEREVCSGEVV